jgi:hypothetical protein
MTDLNTELQEMLTELQIDSVRELAARVKSGAVTAAELGVIRNMLRDNNIQVKPTGNSPLEKLGDALPSFDEDDPVNYRH